MRRAALIGALTIALVPSASSAAVKERTTMAQVLPYVMCVTCKIPLAAAQSPQAEQERAYIEQLIAKGDTLAQVKKALVAQYGDAVLALPPASGFDLTIYVVPVVVVAALAGLLAVLLPRWREREPGVADAGASELRQADAARLDAELAQYDR